MISGCLSRDPAVAFFGLLFAVGNSKLIIRRLKFEPVSAIHELNYILLLFIKLHRIDPVANLLYVVKSVEQRMAVNTHPHKKFMQILVGVENVRRADLRLSSGKTYRFMVRDAVAQNIDAVKFVEHIGVVVLDFSR